MNLQGITEVTVMFGQAGQSDDMLGIPDHIRA